MVKGSITSGSVMRTRILEMAQAKGVIRCSDVTELLSISRSGARYYLAQMVRLGNLEASGEHAGRRYRFLHDALPDPSVPAERDMLLPSVWQDDGPVEAEARSGALRVRVVIEGIERAPGRLMEVPALVAEAARTATRWAAERARGR